jgi:3-deoxy-D-manno-octulosonate 8-phosphate phosphatase (KDO 8-P phosphatase)
MISDDAAERAARITTVVFDVDGVLTDGGIFLDSAGGEIKRFNVQDGTGMKYLMRAGYRLAIVSGRDSHATIARARELDIDDVYQDHKDKMDAYEELKRLHSLTDAEIAFMGDDLPDIPVMRASGLAVAVKNARPEVKGVAHYVTELEGGAGAVREFCEWLLRAADKWDAIMERYRPRKGSI